jgi:hypothetical protein
MKIAKKKPVKDAVKAKVKAIKAKVKGKIKGTCALIGVLLLVAGCMDTAPASRATTATVKEPSVCVDIGGGASNVAVTAYVHVHDLALASADSEGSTETQTATPTLDIRTRIDARYNDAISGATAASKTTLGLIGDGITSVLDMMSSKKSGTVKVTKTDGTAATVKCENGQCGFCEDCTPQ